MSWKISTRGIPQSITGVAPTLDYRFAIDRNEIDAISLTDKLTFTGGNEGTFVGSDGFIQRATTNVPRFDHDPVSRQSLGLLSEVEQTNLLLQSQTPNNVLPWGVLGVTHTTDQADTYAPDGTSSASKLTEAPSGTNQAAVFQTLSWASGNTYTFTVYAKKGSESFIQLVFGFAAFGATGFANFDLNAGQLGTKGSATTSSMQSVTNGWYRCVATATAISTASANAGINIVDSASATRAANATLNSGTIYLWGAQLEAASTPSTYIPTTSAAVTRTADSAVIDGTGVLTGTYTMVEKPAGCAVVSGSNINLQPGFTAERVMVFPAALDAGQITAIRGAM